MSPSDSNEISRRKNGISKTFDGAAATYDQVGPRLFTYFGKKLVENAQIQQGAKVLDVASGRGAVLYPAAESVGANGRVFGIDLSGKMVDELKNELRGRNIGVNVEVRQMDAENLQFPDEFFDHVLCGFAIFFFPQLDLAMSEIRRVLKPGGQICVSTFEKAFEDEWQWFEEIVEKILPPHDAEIQPEDSDSASQPIFDTQEGLASILNKADFAKSNIYSEEADFVYPSAEVFWSTLYSHGMRNILKRIEEEKGIEVFRNFKLDVFKKFSELKSSDGLHQIIPVLIGTGEKT